MVDRSPLPLSDGRCLRVGEHHARDGFVVSDSVAPEDVRGHHAALVPAHLGQWPEPGHVADRPEAVRHAHPLVDGHPLRRGRDPHRVEAQVVDARAGRSPPSSRSPRNSPRAANSTTYSSPSRRTPLACSRGRARARRPRARFRERRRAASARAAGRAPCPRRVRPTPRGDAQPAPSRLRRGRRRARAAASAPRSAP